MIMQYFTKVKAVRGENGFQSTSIDVKMKKNVRKEEDDGRSWKREAEKEFDEILDESKEERRAAMEDYKMKLDGWRKEKHRWVCGVCFFF